MEESGFKKIAYNTYIVAQSNYKQPLVRRNIYTDSLLCSQEECEFEP